jgi:tryptophan-rich sensory protein
MNKAIVHIFLPIIAAIIINVIIYTSDWNNQKPQDQQMSRYLPPGYIIAVVWIIILGLLGYTHYLVYPGKESVIIILAILYCLSYPFLTSGLQQDKAPVYNVLSFVIAVFVLFSVYLKQKRATLYIMPLLLWTLYVSIITVFVNQIKK